MSPGGRGQDGEDVLKVHEKLQRVSITDAGSLGRALSDGRLNRELADAGARQLKGGLLW